MLGTLSTGARMAVNKLLQSGGQRGASICNWYYARHTVLQARLDVVASNLADVR